MKTPEVTAFFDEATNTVSYVVSDPLPAADEHGKRFLKVPLNEL